MGCTWTTILLAGLVCAANVGHAGANVAPATRVLRAGQATDPITSQYDDQTGLWFTEHIDAEGRAKSEVKGKGLVVTKSFAAGRLTLQVKSGSHALSITIAPGEIGIRSGKRTLRLNPEQATEADYDEAKELLARSRVVGRLRSAAAAIGKKVAESPAGFEFLLTEALVALLDGDPSAAQRAKERLQGKVFGLGVQPARAGGNCYSSYRNEVYSAMMSTRSCVNDFAIWNVPMRNLCYFEWTIRIESAWFGFLSCSAVRIW
jgi:hypothetical protein